MIKKYLFYYSISLILFIIFNSITLSLLVFYNRNISFLLFLILIINSFLVSLPIILLIKNIKKILLIEDVQKLFFYIFVIIQFVNMHIIQSNIREDLTIFLLPFQLITMAYINIAGFILILDTLLILGLIITNLNKILKIVFVEILLLALLSPKSVKKSP